MMRSALAALLAIAIAGCSVEAMIFPFLGPQPLSEPPAPLGPYASNERVIQLDDLGDGQPGGITVFEPVGATGARPALVWEQGLNSHAYYQQSFHEYMASWGYIDLVPDARPLKFTDGQFNKRNTDIANRVFSMAADNTEGLNCDAARIALGGYSAGGSMAAFAAGREPRTRALVMWGPAPAWVWLGVDPNELLPGVQAPSLFLLAEFDIVDSAEWLDQMKGLMTQSTQTTVTIPGGVHLYFQEPDPPLNDEAAAATLTRPEQMKIALETTRSFLDEKMGVTH
jgi:dienelactone hydrolase